MQIHDITLTSQTDIRDLDVGQREMQDDFRQLGQLTQLTQACLERKETITDANLTQMHMEQEQNFEALQASFTTSMQPLLAQMEQMTLTMRQGTSFPLPVVSNTHPAFHGPNFARKGSAIRISGTIAPE